MFGDDDEVRRSFRRGFRPEHLSNQSFRSIPHDRSPELLAGDDAEPAVGTGGRGGDDREVTAMGSATGVEYALELPATADSPGGWQSIGRHSGPFEFGAGGWQFPLPDRRARTVNC